MLIFAGTVEIFAKPCGVVLGAGLGFFLTPNPLSQQTFFDKRVAVVLNSNRGTVFISSFIFLLDLTLNSPQPCPFLSSSLLAREHRSNPYFSSSFRVDSMHGPTSLSGLLLFLLPFVLLLLFLILFWSWFLLFDSKTCLVLLSFSLPFKN
jgi:hypothetical protein